MTAEWRGLSASPNTTAKPAAKQDLFVVQGSREMKVHPIRARAKSKYCENHLCCEDPMAHSRTKVSKGYQVVVPAPIRKKHGIEPGDELIWEEEGREIRVVPRKKLSLPDILGMVGYPGDAVQAKRRVQRGGK